MHTNNDENSRKGLEFIEWFEDVASKRPGMLGTASDLSAMFYVVDNIKNILTWGERLPQNLSWNQFLVEKKLLRDLVPIPIEDGWEMERFIELRHEYLKWVEVNRNSIN